MLFNEQSPAVLAVGRQPPNNTRHTTSQPLGAPDSVVCIADGHPIPHDRKIAVNG
jgi:hypothetical protein